MGKNIVCTESGPQPHLWRWVNQFGRIEIGHCTQTQSFIRLLDEGGMVWRGRGSYRSLGAALAAAEAGAARWMKDQLGVTDAT